jgi:hypothetical protein
MKSSKRLGLRPALVTALVLGFGAACSSAEPADDLDAAPSDAGPDVPSPADAVDLAPRCHLPAPTSCPDPPVRYADIEPIVQQRCLSCHDGRGPHWSLIGYQHVADWQDTIRTAMLTCTMPPADANIPMTDDERMLILRWLRCGLLR